MVAVEPAAHPYHDWYDRLTAECYRPFAFARILLDGAAVGSIVNLFERCSFDIAPHLGAWLARTHPELHDRIVAADATHHRAVARSWSSSSLASLDPRDRRTEIAWGISDFVHRFGRRPDAFFLPASDLHGPVLNDLVAVGVDLVITDATVPDGTSPLRTVEGQPVRIVYAHETVTDQLGRGFRLASVTDVAATLSDTASAASVAVAVVDGHVFGHHVAYAERSLAVLAGQELPRLGLAPSAVADAALDAVNEPAPASSVAEEQPWRADLFAAIELTSRYAASLSDSAAPVHLTDPWAARDAYGDVVCGAQSPLELLADFGAASRDDTWALGLLEAHRHLLASRAGLEWAADLDTDATIVALRHLGRAVDALVDIGATPPVAELFEALAAVHHSDDPAITGRSMWEQYVNPARVDALRTAAHLALIRHLRGGAPTRVGAYDVKNDRHARSRRGDLQLDTGRVRCTHRRTLHSVELAYAVMGDTDFDLAGAVRLAGAVLDDDTDAVALHKALSGPVDRDTIRVQLAERFGPLEFGFDALIPEAAPRVLGDIAQGALGGLIRRAIDTGSAADAAAVPRFVRLARSAGVRLDIAPAQEALYLALLTGQPTDALTHLGAELGLAVGRLSAPE